MRILLSKIKRNVKKHNFAKKRLTFVLYSDMINHRNKDVHGGLLPFVTVLFYFIRFNIEPAKERRDLYG